MPKISVITVCYNESDIERTCQSVVNQSYKDFEWIVIDGGSEQKTIDVLNKYKDKMAYFVSEKDNGIYDAMNKGIRQAKGEYVNFLNGGDFYYSKNSLKNIKKYLDFDVVYGNLQIREFVKCPGIQKYPDNIPYGWFVFNTLPHPACFFRRDLFDRFGMYNENHKIVSDWEKNIELIDVHKCSYKHAPYIITSFDANGISSIRDDVHMNERREVLQKFYNLEQIEAPSKRVIKFLGLPIVKIIREFGTCRCYLFGIFPIYKKF